MTLVDLQLAAATLDSEHEPTPPERRIAPGRRTLTMGLPPRANRPEAATPGAEAANDEAADPEAQRQLMDDALRPDLAAGTTSALPADLRERYEAAHRVALDGIVLRHVPTLADAGIRGLSGGREIIVADLSDREALEHELGHVVDVARTGPAAASATISDLDIADDPAREARADAIVAETRDARPAPAATPLLQPAAGGALLPKLTDRADIVKIGDMFDWDSHKTNWYAKGTKFRAKGLGAPLDTDQVPTFTATPAHEQLHSLALVITPTQVDVARPALGDAGTHRDGHKAAFIVPAELLGLPQDNNRVFLPTHALAELVDVQARMVKLATRAPGRLTVDTTFGADRLATKVALVYEALAFSGGATVYTLNWDVTPDLDRTKWATDAASTLAKAGVKPKSAEWKTNVTWKKPHANGDGRGVVAEKLGPDHELGSTPSNAVAAGRVDDLDGIVGKKNYVAGHLLNDHLGGPGDLAANLTPIPKSANSQMASKIEKPAKAIVNDQRGWIRYEVVVTHSADAASGTDYPSQLWAKMEVYDHDGTLKDPTECTITMEPPSAGVKAAAVTGVLGGAARQTSPVRLDEVILSHANDLRPFMRGSAELYELVFRSDLNPNVDGPQVAEAWAKVLELLRTFHVTVLPEVQELARFTDALELWQVDAGAQDFLGTVKVEKLLHDLAAVRVAAVTLATDAQPFLRSAAAALKRDLLPTDLFQDPRVFDLPAGLLAQAPPSFSVLDVLRSQQAAGVPANVADLHSADVPTATAANKRRKAHQDQPPHAAAAWDASPVRIYEDYGMSTGALDVEMHFGARLESGRGIAAIDQLATMLHPAGVAGIEAMLATPDITDSDALRDILTAARHFAANPLPGPVLAATVGTWKVAMARIAEHHPKAALALFGALGVA